MKDAYSVPLSTICVRREMPSRFMNSWANVTSRERLAKSFKASSLASILDDWIRSWSCWAFWASSRTKTKGRVFTEETTTDKKLPFRWKTKIQRPKAQDHMHTLYQGKVSNPNDSTFRQWLLISWWELTAFLTEPIFPTLGKARAQKQ